MPKESKEIIKFLQVFTINLSLRGDNLSPRLFMLFLTSYAK